MNEKETAIQALRALATKHPTLLSNHIDIMNMADTIEKMNFFLIDVEDHNKLGVAKRYLEDAYETLADGNNRGLEVLQEKIKECQKFLDDLAGAVL